MTGNKVLSVFCPSGFPHELLDCMDGVHVFGRELAGEKAWAVAQPVDVRKRIDVRRAVAAPLDGPQIAPRAHVVRKGRKHERGRNGDFVRGMDVAEFLVHPAAPFEQPVDAGRRRRKPVRALVQRHAEMSFPSGDLLHLEERPPQKIKHAPAQRIWVVVVLREHMPPFRAERQVFHVEGVVDDIKVLLRPGGERGMDAVLAFQRQNHARQQMAVRVSAALRSRGKYGHLRAHQTRRAPVDGNPILHEHESGPERTQVPERADIDPRVQMEVDVVAGIVQEADERLQDAGAPVREDAVGMLHVSEQGNGLMRKRSAPVGYAGHLTEGFDDVGRFIETRAVYSVIYPLRRCQGRHSIRRKSSAVKSLAPGSVRCTASKKCLSSSSICGLT